MSDAAPSSRRNRAALITGALWVLGVGLQLAAPLFRARVPLSDDLDITSILMPVWTFLQICLLAGILRAFRGPSRRWSTSWRVAFGVVSALVVMLLQPGFVTIFLGRATMPLSADPLQVALLWSMPLIFYVAPAAVVVACWLRVQRPVSVARALSVALVVIGVCNLLALLWFTHLWRVYVFTTGP